jgi:hypothetical protein
MMVADNICLLTDVSMHRTTATSIGCSFLVLGPPLFAYSNLLTSTPVINHHTHDHFRLQLTIGSAASYTPAAVYPYGADFYSYLQEGEKLWYLVPPDSADKFIDLCAGMVVNITSAEHQRLGVYVVHQHVGDTVYVPGGWAHTSQSVTTTVSFGSSFLHAWKLTETTKYAKKFG